MIEPLRVIIGQARREDLLLPHAGRQLKAFELQRLPRAGPSSPCSCRLRRQVMLLDQVLPIDIRRHRLDSPPEAIERQAVNAGEEAALAPFDVD